MAKRIVVIDDDPVFLELMRDLLGEEVGLEVLTTSDWIGSFEFIKDVRPDLVIVDLMMGRDQTGWTVIDVLRADPSTRDVPIILCSAAVPALDGHAARMREVGAIELVAKPFDVDHLLASIYRLLEHSSVALLGSE